MDKLWTIQRQLGEDLQSTYKQFTFGQLKRRFIENLETFQRRFIDNLKKTQKQLGEDLQITTRQFRDNVKKNYQ